MISEKRIYSFKDLLEIAPLGETALRSRLAEIGYTPNGRKMFFTEAQVEHIIENIAVKYEPIETPQNTFQPEFKAPSPRQIEKKLQGLQKRMEEKVRRQKQKSTGGEKL